MALQEERRVEEHITVTFQTEEPHGTTSPHRPTCAEPDTVTKALPHPTPSAGTTRRLRIVFTAGGLDERLRQPGNRYRKSCANEAEHLNTDENAQPPSANYSSRCHRCACGHGGRFRLLSPKPRTQHDLPGRRYRDHARPPRRGLVLRHAELSYLFGTITPT